MHEHILQEIEQVKSNKELTSQQRLDALFEIKNNFTEQPRSWIMSESRNILFFLV